MIAHTRLYSCGSHYDGINYVSLMEPGEMVVAHLCRSHQWVHLNGGHDGNPYDESRTGGFLVRHVTSPCDGSRHGGRYGVHLLLSSCLYRI